MNLYIKPKDGGVQVKLEMTYLGYIEFLTASYHAYDAENNSYGDHAALAQAVAALIQQNMPVITQRIINEYAFLENTLGRTLPSILAGEVQNFP